MVYMHLEAFFPQLQYVLAQKAQDYFFPNENRNLSKIAPGMGFLAGIAYSVLMASSPLAQKAAASGLIGAFIGPQFANNSIVTDPLQSFLDIVGPQFSSLSSVFCGAAGTVLGCWAFHKLS